MTKICSDNYRAAPAALGGCVDDRESNIRQARVYLAQARVTPHHAWKLTLINWAGKRRRMISKPKSEPQQGDLFA